MQPGAIPLLTIAAIFATSSAAAQSTISVDLLDPTDEGFEGIPAYRRCVDVYVDIDPADVWTVAGVHNTAHLGATIIAFDRDPNNFSAPWIFAPGVEHKFDTSFSRPRGRDAIARFANNGASPAGGYDPPAPMYTVGADLLDVAYFSSPPPTSGSPSADGYIARIAVDVSAVVPSDDYAGWFVGDLAGAPPGALIVLRSEPVSAAAGTVFATYDDPTIRGINWGLWYVPEPATICGLAFVTSIMLRRSRG